MKKLIFPAAVLIAGFLSYTSSSFGTQQYSKKEKKNCNYCHVKVVKDTAEMTKNLKPVGTCYKDNDHSLAKCSTAK